MMTATVASASKIGLQKPLPPTANTIVYAAQGATIYSGSPIEADSTNTVDSSWEILLANDTVVGNGSLSPGDIKDISFPNEHTVIIRNLVGFSNTFTVDENTITLEPNDSYTDECLGTNGAPANNGCPFGIKGNVILEKVYKTGTPTIRETTDAKIKIFDKTIKNIPPANRYAETFNGTLGFVAECTANQVCGLTTGGDYYAIAEYTNPAGDKVYDFKQIKFDNNGSATAELLFINQYDSNGDFLESVGNQKQLFSSLQNQKSNASNTTSLWKLVETKINNGITDREIANMVKDIAKKNDISIPEWGIAGRLDSRTLSASVLSSLVF